MAPAMAATRKKKSEARHNIAFIYVMVYRALKLNIYSNTASKHLSVFPFSFPPIMYHSCENIIL
jgi:hypothetical protein